MVHSAWPCRCWSADGFNLFRHRQLVPDQSRYRVTPFKANGLYPRGSFGTSTARFFADDKVVFAVTPDVTWSREGDLPYSEVDWMQPELVRLLGALMFCERFTDRRCSFYPIVHGDVFVSGCALDFEQAKSVKAVRDLVVGLAPFASPLIELADRRMDGLFKATELNISWMRRYWHAISPNNLVLMRAIQAMVKCDMLSSHPEFQEEAGIATFIAMDATFELVLRHLKSLGVKNPTSVDAGTWLYRTFDEPLGFPSPEPARFFGEFYDLRIQTIHPGSRHGDSPYATLAIDDRIHLRQAIPGTLAYLLTQAYAPDFYDRLCEEHERLIPKTRTQPKPSYNLDILSSSPRQLLEATSRTKHPPSHLTTQPPKCWTCYPPSSAPSNSSSSSSSQA